MRRTLFALIAAVALLTHGRAVAAPDGLSVHRTETKRLVREERAFWKAFSKRQVAALATWRLFWRDRREETKRLGHIPTTYVDISGFVQTKQLALECYQSEIRDFPHPRSKEGVEAMAKARGTRAGLSAAEAFVMVYSEWL